MVCINVPFIKNKEKKIQNIEKSFIAIFLKGKKVYLIFVKAFTKLIRNLLCTHHYPSVMINYLKYFF